tara:strand:+ start:354 stop:491 length:138 start_codon:yes stop_codon:yes gene_type:complete
MPLSLGITGKIFLRVGIKVFRKKKVSVKEKRKCRDLRIKIDIFKL